MILILKINLLSHFTLTGGLEESEEERRGEKKERTKKKNEEEREGNKRIRKR
jgi:hypothetical protein